jgi:hypothetical protein
MTMEVTYPLLDSPYFFITMSRISGAKRRLSRHTLVKEDGLVGEPSVPVVGQRVAKLGGIKPPFTVGIK